ncbi:ribosome biogenesis GTPase YlqF [Caldinitratiruptor microaerophilus]|uniref:Ribosome biogenesis GTPase A n=1 Tax=Caldinitratiruptor microaerophilus TaxID=671077 RepID=A0AA35CNG8_9FIRM|nr:ribosome biogenesis GTPase YlqF [Caldinitratiruptor microaerophilus]BDG60596.1 ribosome biogenesis GTPase A [Caldinitratiruptor microaerophilus]
MGSISWFPGHMVRARRQVAEALRLVDVVVEVRDARAPAASANPDLAQLAGRRPRVVALAHADLADPAATGAWLRHLSAQGLTAVAVDAARGTGVREVLVEVRRLYEPVVASLGARGRLPRPARVMVVGMPNVGKSSLLNRMAGGRRARVGEKPGVTRGLQWVRVGDLELLDVPGILVPRFVDPRTGYLLVALGIVREEVVDIPRVAAALLPDLQALAPGAVRERFGLEGPPADPEAALAQVARFRGLLRPGGLPDADRAAALILRELREGRLGRLTLEQPPEPLPGPDGCSGPGGF